MRSKYTFTACGRSSSSATLRSSRCAGSAICCNSAMAFNSLRAQLLGWLLVPLALCAVSSAWFTYGNAMETATVIQDRLLLGSAHMIAQQAHYDEGGARVGFRPAA